MLIAPRRPKTRRVALGDTVEAAPPTKSEASYYRENSPERWEPIHCGRSTRFGLKVGI
jgi:hypothetical protein